MNQLDEPSVTILIVPEATDMMADDRPSILSEPLALMRITLPVVPAKPAMSLNVIDCPELKELARSRDAVTAPDVVLTAQKYCALVTAKLEEKV